ncbi:MAG: PilN domain-containing protein [Vicinamibacterales bacterium]|nr:PilN domain-containing protein [Vicinamibacterales bacterium]
MIRINLIATERRAAKAASSVSTFQIGQKATVAGSLILLITVLLIGWRFWTVTQQETQMASDIVAAQREEQRLAEIIKQVEDFELRRGQLQERVTLIEELRRGQNAPVHMLDQVSRALPDMLWLTRFTQQGFDVTIEGRCMSLTALSDFVANLEESRYFQRPVEIVNSEVVAARGTEPELIQFVVRATFQLAGVDQPAPAPTRRGAAKRGPRG